MHLYFEILHRIVEKFLKHVKRIKVADQNFAIPESLPNNIALKKSCVKKTRIHVSEIS